MGTLVKNGVAYGGGSGGTTDYEDLSNLPSINGTSLVGNKTSAELGIITKAVDDLVNYYTKSATYSKSEVDNIVLAIKNSRFEAVSSLPTTNIKTNVIYLVPKSSSETSDVKDEYINLDGTTAGWEKIGSTDVDLSGYVSDQELNTALADYTTTANLTILLAAKQDTIQVSSLPTASADNLGKILEYTGATENGLTHGYFYECVSDGASTPTYSWQQTNVQPSSGGGGGGHTIEDSEGTALTQRDTLQFGEGFKAEDDDTNEKTVISPDVMQSGDMDDVITPLPSVAPKKEGIKYSTTEQVVGEWIDGKPLYQKTIVKNNFEIRQNASFAHGINNVDHIFIKEGYLTDDGNSVIFPPIWTDTYDGVYINATNVVFKGTGVWGAQITRTIYLTVRYTKTTT